MVHLWGAFPSRFSPEQGGGTHHTPIENVFFFVVVVVKSRQDLFTDCIVARGSCTTAVAVLVASLAAVEKS